MVSSIWEAISIVLLSVLISGIGLGVVVYMACKNSKDNEKRNSDKEQTK
jgi:uncharacterized membrane protein